MDPNNLNPNQQQQGSTPQPVGQPQQPQAVVNGSQPYTPQPVAQPMPPTSQPQMTGGSYGPQKSKKGLMIGVIVAVVAILVIGGILFALLGKKTPSTSSTANSSSSSTSSSSATTTSKSACELFTLSDAQAILGSSATAGASAGPTNAGSVSQSICNYSGSGNIAGINIIFDVSSKGAGATAGFQAGQSADSSNVSVSGVGDKAFYGSDIQTLGVLKGDVFFTVLVNSKDGSSTQSQATQVANTIIGNL